MEKALGETFGERVYRLRTELGLSQGQLAKKIGASHGSIQNYEKNSLPKGEFAIKLAEVFDCSIDWLLTGREVKNSGESGHYSFKEDMDPEELKKILKEHHDIIKRFQDPEAGKEANEILLQIEQLSAKDFHRCIGFLEARLYDLKKRYDSTDSAPDSHSALQEETIKKTS